MKKTLQLFPALSPPIEAALRASIERFGVLVPVVKDQHGRIVDGHHRSRIADELGREYRVDTVDVADEDEAQAVARTLNADRRHLTEEQRREVVALLAGETVAVGRDEVARHSPQAIAGALGVALDTVQRDMEQLTDVGKLARPAKTLGRDGKVYPSKKAPVAHQPEPVAVANGRKVNRRALPAAMREATVKLLRAAESVDRLHRDDRWKENAPKIDPLTRDNLRRATELLAAALASLKEMTPEENA